MATIDPHAPKKNTPEFEPVDIDTCDFSLSFDVIRVKRALSRGQFDDDAEAIKQILEKIDPNLNDNLEIALQILGNPKTRIHYGSDHLAGWGARIVFEELNLRSATYCERVNRLHSLGMLKDEKTKEKIALLFSVTVDFKQIFIDSWFVLNGDPLNVRNAFTTPVEMLVKFNAQQYYSDIYDDLINALFERNEPDEYRYLAHALNAMEGHLKSGAITLKQQTIEQICEKIHELEAESDKAKLFTGRLSPENLFSVYMDSLTFEMSEQNISR